jgi:diaminohydroxyphosphoribosylaminopyrimidine deaminase/5-amino-6-(5-phosphoribosylamino)uracil reductase
MKRNSDIASELDAMSVLFWKEELSKRNLNRDEKFMTECLKLAEKGKGYVSPNPLVGAVLAIHNTIVARGWHKRYGGAHAEVACLSKYGGSLRNATLYVNLEPCNHFGKTPPCVDVILERGIKRVVVAIPDPNPLVAGKGIARLRKGGVDVQVGVLQKESEMLNRFFIKHILEKTPYIHVKIAQTQDGFIAREKGRMKYITSPESRKLVHTWRKEYDAVLIGAGTLKADNPLLDTRLAKGRDPDVVILDGKFSVSGNERVFSSAKKRRVFICTTSRALSAQKKKAGKLADLGVEFVLPNMKKTRLDLRSTLRKLYRLNIGSILIEGGRDVFSQFVLGNLIDEMSLFVAPMKLRSGIPAMSQAALEKLSDMLVTNEWSGKRVGRDTLITSRIKH